MYRRMVPILILFLISVALLIIGVGQIFGDDPVLLPPLPAHTQGGVMQANKYCIDMGYCNNSGTQCQTRSPALTCQSISAVSWKLALVRRLGQCQNQQVVGDEELLAECWEYDDLVCAVTKEYPEANCGGTYCVMWWTGPRRGQWPDCP